MSSLDRSHSNVAPESACRGLAPGYRWMRFSRMWRSTSLRAVALASQILLPPYAASSLPHTLVISLLGVPRLLSNINIYPEDFSTAPYDKRTSVTPCRLNSKLYRAQSLRPCVSTGVQRRVTLLHGFQQTTLHRRARAVSQARCCCYSSRYFSGTLFSKTMGEGTALVSGNVPWALSTAGRKRAWIWFARWRGAATYAPPPPWARPPLCCC